MKKMNKKLATASCDLHDDPEIIENFGEPFSQRGKGYYVIRPNFFAWKLMSTEKLTFFSAEGPESWYHWRAANSDGSSPTLSKLSQTLAFISDASVPRSLSPKATFSYTFLSFKRRKS